MQTIREQEEQPEKRDSHSPEHSIAKSVWLLAWPAMITSLLQVFNSFLDRMFVGKLGPDALAAVGVGGQMIFLNMTVGMAVTIGTTAVVARHVGAREWDAVYKAARQALGLAFVIGVFASALSFMFLPALINWFQLSPGADKFAHEFLGTALWGLPGSFVLFGLSGTFRGMGNTRSPMYAMFIANVVHIAGDYVLIFGHCGFPKMGIQGAGIAMAASLTAAAFVLWVQQWFSKHRAAAVPEFPVREWSRRILRVGIPASLRNVIYVTSGTVFTRLLTSTPQGTKAVAALPIGLTAESIAFMPGIAFAMAASALVGQNLGAKNEKRAERCGWVAAWQACGVMTVMAVVFYVFAEQFARWFTQDPEVIELATAYLRINALTEPLLAFGMVLPGALQGAGDAIRPVFASLFTQWIFRLPVAYLLAVMLGFGAVGAWWAMALSSAVGGVLMISLFASGAWKKAKV